MDRLLSMSMFVCRLGVSRHGGASGTAHTGECHDKINAGVPHRDRGQLNEDYQPTLAKPLPTELKDLVARLVALEINKRGSSRRAIAVLQSRAAQPEPKA
jgi:hypothetical protein